MWQRKAWFRAASSWAGQDRRLLQAVFNVQDAMTGAGALMSQLQLQHRGMDASAGWAVLGPPSDTTAANGKGEPPFSLAIQSLHPSAAVKPSLGEGFGHWGLAVSNCYKAIEMMRSAGAKVVREAGPVKGGTNVIAFVEVDGYKYELLHRPHGVGPQPIAQVMIRCSNLERSIAWYKMLGMRLLRSRDAPEHKYTVAFMGYGDAEDTCTVVELTYNSGKSTYALGNGYSHLVISTQEDLDKTRRSLGAHVQPVPSTAQVQGSQPPCDVVYTGRDGKPLCWYSAAAGQEATRHVATPLNAVGVLDPDGYQVLLVPEATA